MNVANFVLKAEANQEKRTDQEVAVEDVSFICGASLQDQELPGGLNNGYTRELSCGELAKGQLPTVQ